MSLMKNVKKKSTNNTNYVIMKIDNFRGRYRKLCVHVNASIIGKTKSITYMTWEKNYPVVNITDCIELDCSHTHKVDMSLVQKIYENIMISI